ncbi:hypothetical protein C483_15272 [Natrialba hulunbeirensis JCM 10989]|uniref:eCIS core domain-containing protein n=1 Tax=Natrialba hulunbeirensis JCM 10989 TaxID=1227493 RepID=L9ZRK1_9EURY|nr:DUF4157 domain-containing protein [Natrialba hulunbeirensis]ELY88711.1 hypothetical protein C483_15272 [Natrialba hulunbeirensis JCM 10989]
MGRKRTRKRASKSTDTDESSESQTKRRSSSSTRSKKGGPLTGTAVVDQSLGDDINALTGQPEGFDAMAGSNTPDFEPLLTGADAQIQRALEGTDTTQDEVPDTVLDVLGEGGRLLEQPIQRALEERMDADFSNVRVHTGAKAAEAADAIDAKAFTCGNDIVFNSGEYDTESPKGQHLLAHELAHVNQQNGGAPISMMPKEGADLEIDPDPQLEREADKEAQRVMKGAELGLESLADTNVHVQRTPKSVKSLKELSELFDVQEYIDDDTELVGDDGTIDSAAGRTVTENMRKQIDGLPERDNTNPPYSIKQNVTFAILRLNESTLTVAVASGKRRSNEDEEQNPLLPGPYKNERHYDHRSNDNSMNPAAMWCTEPKLLEHVAQEYDPETTEGEILLFTERPPCDAGCEKLIELFESEYPGVNVNVSYDPDMEGN